MCTLCLFETQIVRLYSTFVAPSFYYFFPDMTMWMAGKEFYSNEGVITEMNFSFAGLEQRYYLEQINKL